jgi:hypothetical protein
MKSKDRIKHICLVRPENSTSEHAEALAVQAGNLGVKTCFLSLTSNPRLTWLNSISCRAHVLFRRSSYIFLSSPYLEHQPNWLVSGNFKLAYAGYGLPLSNWEFGHFSNGLTEKCKLLIAGSDYEFLGYRKVGGVSQKILLAGNPLMWQIRDQIKKRSIQKSGVKQILWAPHWTSSWMNSDSGYSRWRQKALIFFEFAKMHPEINFVFRPHPLLRDGLFAAPNKNNEIYQREIQKSLHVEKDRLEIEILKEFIKLPNVTLSTVTMSEDILQSDALITSGVSIIGYWAATGKPMVIYRDSASPAFGINGERLILSSETVSTPTELLLWLEKTINLAEIETNHSLVKCCEKIFPTFKKSPMQLILESW